MIYPEPSSQFLYAFASLLRDTGEVNGSDPVTKESFDRALRAYIRNVVKDINYYEGDGLDD